MKPYLVSLKNPPRLGEAFKIAAALLLTLLFVLLTFTFLHESGHLLVGLAFGARVTSFSVNFINFSAHVGLDGAFSPLQNALISAAGVSFPLILWAVFISLVPRKGHILLEWLKLTLSMSIVNALLAWIAVPILTLQGQTIGDDSANFLRYTQFHPLLVSAAALFVYLNAIALYLSRAGGLSALVANLRFKAVDLSSPQARQTLSGMAASGVLFAAAALGLGLAFGVSRQAAVPPGYQPVGSYDLTQTSFSDATVYVFDLNQPAQVSLFFTLSDVQGSPLEIRMSGPDNYNNVFFRVTDPDFKGIGAATVHPQNLALAPGQYHVRLTFPPGRGKIGVYVKN